MKGLIIKILLGAAGVTLLMYPWISNVHNERVGKSEINTLEQEIEDMDDSDTEAYFEAARQYNASLAGGQAMLVDPFLGDEEAEEAGDYDDLLAYSESGIMGWIEIPSINVYLPVYHGTSSEVLEHGIGHLEGSSLPVGGESTHAVLTGHTGLVNARLFTDLTELKEGDWFFFHILGETLAYQVSEITVVTPDETDGLRVREGEDLMTLLTCTPYGINDHRLFVTGTRGEYSEETYEEEAAKTSDTTSLWMRKYRNALIVAAFVVAGFIIIVVLLRRRKQKQLGQPEKQAKSSSKKHTISDAEKRRRKQKWKRFIRWWFPF